MTNVNVDKCALVLTDVCVIALSVVIHSSASVHFKVSVLKNTFCCYTYCTVCTSAHVYSTGTEGMWTEYKQRFQ